MRPRPFLLALAVVTLAACGGSSPSADSVTDTTDPSASTTAPSTTAAVAASSSTAPSTTLSGTERELQIASVNGVTLAAVKLNAALLAKAGWGDTTAATTTTLASGAASSGSAASQAGTSAREAAVLLSVLASSSAPKGYSIRSYGSAGVVDVWDGRKVTAKDLTGLVEYIELADDSASVCLRPSTNGKSDTAQAKTANDAYRTLPIGELVQPASTDGWIIMLRIAEPDACRTALDTANAP